MVGEAILVAADCGKAVAKHYGDTFGTVAALPLPTHRSKCVAGRSDSCNSDASQCDFFAITDSADFTSHRSHRVMQACLRIARVVLAAAQDGGGVGAGIDRRSAQLLQAREAADMVIMLMAGEQGLHFGDRVAKRGDIGFHDLRSRLGPAVDQHDPRIADNQDRSNAAGAHVIDIAVDLVWRGGLVPFVPIGAGSGPSSAVLFRGKRCRGICVGAACTNQCDQRCSIGDYLIEHNLLHWRRSRRRSCFRARRARRTR